MTQYIERAGYGLPVILHDAELRHRCRNAPDFVRKNIDARREERGLPPLWPAIAQRKTVATKPGHRRPAHQSASATIARLKAYVALQRAR